jgi:hypothetical protein
MARTLLALTACVALVAGCAKSDKDEDTSTDTAVDTSPDADATDTATDVEEEDAPPATCAGSETLNLEFLDPDEAPIEGVVVVLECGDDVHEEATSGADGTASFSGLNLSATPVDFTYIHDGVARSWVGAGGPARTLPDPLSLTLGRADPEPTVSMSGDLVHATDGSTMLVIGEGGYADLTTETRYTLDSLVGTGLVLYAIEWTTTGDVGTALGYQVVTYDSPTGGADGPTVGPVDGTLSSTSIDVTFDISTDSQILDAWLPTDDPYSNRLISGFRVSGTDADDEFHFGGLTIDWENGFSAPTATVVWIPEAVSASTNHYNSLMLPDRERNSWAIFDMPDDPSSWASTLTVEDTPTLPGMDMYTPVEFDHEFTWTLPTWATFFMTFHLRLNDSGGALYQDQYQWTVILHPETTSLRFSDLPWPEGEDYEAVLFSGLTLRCGYSARAFDADPYDGYVLYTDDTWAEAHYLGSMGDSRYQLHAP